MTRKVSDVELLYFGSTWSSINFGVPFLGIVEQPHFALSCGKKVFVLLSEPQRSVRELIGHLTAGTLNGTFQWLHDGPHYDLGEALLQRFPVTEAIRAQRRALEFCSCISRELRAQSFWFSNALDIL